MNIKCLDRRKTYVVGVSGGSDSMFLLEKMRLNNFDTIVAHVNYKKRKESDEEEKKILGYCLKNQIRFEVKRDDLKCDEKKRGNFQQYARNLRFKFFKSVADKYKTREIVLAHHLDDLIETYIMQKNKNSLVNWWGIRECMEIENYRFWRPILNISKKEIVKYLKTNRIEYSIDKSNFEDIYTRNVIRKEIKDITIGEKKKILKEIENKNKKLKKNIKEIIKKIDVYKSSIDLKEVKSNKFNGEEIQRIFFLWVNQQTNNFLTKRKKKILREITRQLLESKKKEISINIGGGFVISKVGDISIIVRKNT